MSLTERRKADRIVMAKELAALVNAMGHGINATIDNTPPLSPRGVWINITTPMGLSLTVDFDGQTTQPNIHVLSWHSELRSTFKLARHFAPNVNTCHWQKATDICEGFDSVCAIVKRRLESVIDGTAFQ